MVDCNVVKAKVYPYADGELPPTIREAMEEHLVGCPSCRRLVESELADRKSTRLNSSHMVQSRMPSSA